MALSVDTTKLSVARAALDGGADLLNDVWGVGPDDGLMRLAAERVSRHLWWSAGGNGAGTSTDT